MRLASVLSVLMVVAGVGSASAQYGDDGAYELRKIARSLDNIDWELFSQGLERDTARGGAGYYGGGGIGYGGSYGAGRDSGGGFMVYRGYSNGTHYYRFQSYEETRAKAAASRAKLEAKRAKLAARRAKAKDF